MSRQRLRRIQLALLSGEYDLTDHAVAEMHTDSLTLFDIENAILTGGITRTQTDDPRGPRHTVIGWAEDRRTEVATVGRFTETDIDLIITVYAVTEPGE